MSLLKYTYLFLLLLLPCLINAQGSIDGIPQYTPEQEAAKQTEAMQREVNLTSAQFKLIYQINLKYAKERLSSNIRTEALERMRKKNEEYQTVLTQDQFRHLQNKRLESRTRPMNPDSSIKPIERMNIQNIRLIDIEPKSTVMYCDSNNITSTTEHLLIIGAIDSVNAE